MSARILLADDHQILREGLRALLEKQADMEIVGEAGDGAMAIHQVRELHPDVVIMDINMEGIDGIEATRIIKREYPETKIVALSVYLRSSYLSEMFRNGASGYLLKEAAFAEVVHAIKTVLAGQKYICPKVASLLVKEYMQEDKRTDSRIQLTERETEVTRMLATGKSSKEIAFITHKSVKTVDACRRRIMRKLDINNIPELVLYAIRKGLIEVDDGPMA